MAQLQVISSAKLSRIAQLASYGKSQSVRTRYTNELNRIYTQYQSIANRRLANLRKYGFDYGEAYEQAMGYIALTDVRGAKYYHKPISIQGIERQLQDISAFLRDPSSTVRYQRSREARIASDFEIISDILKFQANSEKTRNIYGTSQYRHIKEFMQMLGSETFQQLLTLYISTDIAVEKIYTLYESDKEALLANAEKFAEYQKDATRGMTSSEIMEWLDSRYNSFTKRRR